jgi:3-oxoacyl-[acyl-carrier protein] reductase
VSNISAKSIIITGSRKGIGKFLAERYLAAGFRVAGCSRGEASIQHEGYAHYQLDVSDEKAVVQMVRDVGRKSGLDALINNAGLAAMNHLLLSSGTTGRKIFDCNFFGSFFFLREAAKIMQKSKNGRIVNFTTVAVALDLEGEALYASSKAAVETLTRVAARELGDFGITVNAVGPTPVKTDLIRQVPPDKIEALLARQAIKRFGEMEDVAQAVDFFLNENSGFITGQILYLGGVND